MTFSTLPSGSLSAQTHQDLQFQFGFRLRASFLDSSRPSLSSLLPPPPLFVSSLNSRQRLPGRKKKENSKKKEIRAKEKKKRKNKRKEKIERFH
ncbi:hypothetical protein ASPZODRAFT_2098851 [Penicilliopsis zonata CBS 506.65]|uniref:Uncharacterized protein n=1 Tax=Penicilliopsis zonata CBS 506.65 TaxID=1073090 RepID=A0A1L9SGJ3_9EURO|nr:hypothetical protein ASPZODRAFT_2098851 [Penicilliopsis zonata CBS 506.65]OJJ46299.1 hypothetical protein ASPZODRAFT_2098851 [Penicilliopsis zonata CBS 506.65]